MIAYFQQAFMMAHRALEKLDRIIELLEQLTRERAER